MRCDEHQPVLKGHGIVVDEQRYRAVHAREMDRLSMIFFK